MTNPNPPVANLRATVDIDASDVPGDLERDLRRVGRDLDDDVDETGDDLGTSFGRGFGRGARRTVDAEAESLGREIIDIFRALSDRLDSIDLRDRSRRAGRRAGEAATDGFASSFSRISSVITGPLGAIFNISGRSPLLLVLLPVLGAIIALITAAVYGLQALASQLFLIPSLLFAIGLQAIALQLIFDGVGETIAAAFAATNAEELEKALDGVGDGLANVVRQLIPWRDFFRDLRSSAQGAFFGEFGTELTDILNSIRGPLAGAINGIAASMGGALATALQAFTTPEFAKFLEIIGGSTSEWLAGLGPALATVIAGLTDLGIALDPFLDLFGEKFNEAVTGFGEWLTELSQDPEFIQWMKDSIPVIRDFIEFLGGLWDLVKTIIKQFSEADKELQKEYGVGFLDLLTESIKAFVEILGSELGKDAMKAFIIFLVTSTIFFFALAAAILLVFAGLQKLFDLFKEIHDFIVNDLLGLGDEGGPIGKLKEAGNTVISTFSTGVTEFGNLVNQVALIVEGGMLRASSAASTAASAIKDTIVGFFTDAGSWLTNPGASLIEGLKAGIRSASPGLYGLMSSVAGAVKSFWPFSPAEQGPLSGSGDLKYAGQSIVKQLITGIQMEAPKLAETTNSLANTVNFGPGAVQLTYNGGQPPTRQQAAGMGMAAGRSLVEQLLNTQMAVRTL